MTNLEDFGFVSRALIGFLESNIHQRCLDCRLCSLALRKHEAMPNRDSPELIASLLVSRDEQQLQVHTIRQLSFQSFSQFQQENESRMDCSSILDHQTI